MVFVSAIQLCPWIAKASMEKYINKWAWLCYSKAIRTYFLIDGKPVGSSLWTFALECLRFFVNMKKKKKNHEEIWHLAQKRRKNFTSFQNAYFIFGILVIMLYLASISDLYIQIYSGFVYTVSIKQTDKNFIMVTLVNMVHFVFRLPLSSRMTAKQAFPFNIIPVWFDFFVWICLKHE